MAAYRIWGNRRLRVMVGVRNKRRSGRWHKDWHNWFPRWMMRNRQRKRLRDPKSYELLDSRLWGMGYWQRK